MVNKLTIVGPFVFDALHPNITSSRIITRKTTYKNEKFEIRWRRGGGEEKSQLCFGGAVVTVYHNP